MVHTLQAWLVLTAGMAVGLALKYVANRQAFQDLSFWTFTHVLLPPSGLGHSLLRLVTCPYNGRCV